MEAVLRGSTCVQLFMYWTRSGRADLCRLLTGPTDAACAALLPWVFSGKGAIGTLFKYGGAFPYTMTGSMAHMHGTPLDRAALVFFSEQISVYSMHPPAVLAPMALLQHTVHETRLYARICELRADGALKFYQKMCELEESRPLLGSAALSALIAEFEIIVTKVARTHLIPIKTTTLTEYITRWDAAILRLFI